MRKASHAAEWHHFQLDVPHGGSLSAAWMQRAPMRAAPQRCDALRGVFMSKEMVISATPHETRVAIMEDGQLCEIYIEREKEFALSRKHLQRPSDTSSPGMQSAFVDIGLDSDAFLYVSDFLEHLEEYDQSSTRSRTKIHASKSRAARFAVSVGGNWQHGTGRIELTRTCGASGAARYRCTEGANFSARCAADAEARSRRPRNPAAADRPDGHRNRGRSDLGNPGRRAGTLRPAGLAADAAGARVASGRDLPPSKYASPRTYDAPASRAPRSPEPGYEPIILPGESLAKYKDRAPSSPHEPRSHRWPVGHCRSRSRSIG